MDGRQCKHIVSKHVLALIALLELIKVHIVPCMGISIDIGQRTRGHRAQGVSDSLNARRFPVPSWHESSHVVEVVVDRS
jgi:hypothetical protein